MRDNSGRFPEAYRVNITALIPIHVRAISLPVVCVTCNYRKSSSVCLSSHSAFPEETSELLQGIMLLHVSKGNSACFDLSVRAMCPCVTVNQRAICTVTLT